MRYSQLFGKTSKTAPADAESINARLLTQGGFINKQMAGVYNYLPLGLRVLNRIQNIVREEMNAIGAQELLMPALTSVENYSLTGRDQMDILFKTEGQSGGAFFLNPTHEEVVTPLAKTYTFSYRDLPLSVYQIQTKFRNEPRAKSGLLRGREFNMKDLYSFHANEEDLNNFYEQVTQSYFRIYERLGLKDRVVLTYASGGAFSQYSHEFQALSEIGEDTIYLCSNCRLAVNKEIISEQSSCPQCGNKTLLEQKAIEVGNIFKLGTKFSESFSFTCKNAEGVDKPVPMGCYGLGPSRIMGTIVEIFHDEKGIIWPAAVAPYKVHLLAIGPDEQVQQEAEKLYHELLENQVEVLFDERGGVSAGEKFSDADLIGLPLRAIISKKTITQNGVEVKSRTQTSGSMMPIAEFMLELVKNK